MALIDLKTNLKSLKFGNDQFDGGSSNQPYIQTPIPDEFGEYGFLNQDFILRGGSRAITDSLIDVKRLGKYFTDTKNPSGFLFIIKQNLLSRIAVRTQTSGLLNEGIYTPLSTLTQAGVNAFGIHVNKQGLNPFNGIGSLRTYTDVINPELGEAFSIKSIDKNRLVLLAGSKITDTLSANPLTTGISPLPTDILTYSGGPGSDLGIGKTNIRFADQRTGLNNINYGKDKNYQGKGYTNSNETQTNIGSASQFELASFKYNQYIANNNSSSNIDNILTITSFKSSINSSGSNYYYIIGSGGDRNRSGIGGLFYNYIPPAPNFPQNAYNVNTNIDTGDNITYTREDLTNPDLSTPYTKNLKVQDFRNILRSRINSIESAVGNNAWNILSTSPSYLDKNIEKRVNLGDPGSPIQKNLKSYVSGSISGSASNTSYDKINVSPIYQSSGPQGTNNPDNNNDLVKFRIGVYDLHKTELPKNYIHFRAFLNQISDTYAAEWNPTKYIGRGENFYTYGGFDRKFSLSWTVAAQSKIELIPMYKKLNYLASICAPDYSANGYMRGNIVTLTVGGYLYEQPGIITGLSYEMNDDNATWEISIPDNDVSPFYDSSVKELPHLIKVTGFNFIPIHDFVPRLQQNNYGRFDTEKPYIDSNNYGPERFIALSANSNSDESNYGTIYRPKK
jgi:hypothetical protein